MKKIILISLLLLLMAGCSINKASQWQQSTLYFGLSQKDTTEVTPEQWQNFVDLQITPRFPDGLTIIDAYGQWKNETGHIIVELSKMVIILHPVDTESMHKLNEIRENYKKSFQQESVMLTSQSMQVDF